MVKGRRRRHGLADGTSGLDGDESLHHDPPATFAQRNACAGAPAAPLMAAGKRAHPQGPFRQRPHAAGVQWRLALGAAAGSRLHARSLRDNQLFIVRRRRCMFTRTPGRCAVPATDDDKDWDPLQARRARGLHAITFSSSVEVAGLSLELRVAAQRLRMTVARIGIRCRQEEQDACRQWPFNRPSPSLGFNPDSGLRLRACD